jgi:hypothetical protein
MERIFPLKWRYKWKLYCRTFISSLYEINTYCTTASNHQLCNACSHICMAAEFYIASKRFCQSLATLELLLVGSLKPITFKRSTASSSSFKVTASLFLLFRSVLLQITKLECSTSEHAAPFEVDYREDSRST